MGLEFNNDIEGESEFRRIYERYKLLALNMFVWKNLPKGVESRHIEKALYENGQAIFYNDNDLGLICLPCTNSGKFNVFNESKTVIANGLGLSKNVKIILSIDDKKIYNEKSLKGVRILNNDLMLGTKMPTLSYSKKMFNVENAIDINIDQQKIPYIIPTSKNTELTLKNLFDKVRKGAFAIFVDKNFQLDTNVIKLNPVYVGDKLNAYRYELEREILTYFGLNNSIEKKERMIVDEVNSNNDFIQRNVDLMYKSRLECCSLINQVYGLNLIVEKVGVNEKIINENEED